MKLSIVIPVYNVEDYIEKCLSSCIDQNVPLSDYEIIVVNDGTKDNSVAIIEQFINKADNISLINRENGGLSAARNTGLNAAKGDYIWFVDSDDWIESNCLQDLLKYLDDTIDVLAFRAYISEGGRSTNPYNFHNDVKDKMSLFHYGFTDPAQFYIYRRRFLSDNNLTFKEGIKHEDIRFTPIALHLASTLSVYEKPLYHFLKRAGSITTVSDKKRLSDLADTLEYLIKFSKTIVDERLKQSFQNHISHHMLELVVYGMSNGKEGEILFDSIIKKNADFWEILRLSTDLKPRMFYWAIKFSPFDILTTCKVLVFFRKIIK